jgi:hypothetical protein
MDLELQRPTGLEDRGWTSIEGCLERLRRAAQPESTEPEFVMGWDAVGPIGGGLPVG